MKNTIQYISIKICFISLIAIVISMMGCKKYLDDKPDQSLVVPETVADVQALLDNNSYMNNYGQGTGDASADDYYLTDVDWSSLSSEGFRNIYIWGEEIFFDQYPNEWAFNYRAIYYSNVVIDALNKIEKTSQNMEEWNNAKGSALFFRAKNFFSIAAGWAKAYDATTAGSDPGIPLRVHPDFNENSIRATVKQTYDRIVSDLKESIPQLPEFPVHVMRPSRVAAFALLSRVYLTMGLYPEAEMYADSSMLLKNDLMDYNLLNVAANIPIVQNNVEVLFHNSVSHPNLSASRAKIDSSLYNSYDINDLRKQVFFRSNGDGSYRFKGNYSGNTGLFFGLATDEMYLIKSECLARKGDVDEAMKTLNALMINRWKRGLFVPFTATNPTDALNIILVERRKELLMRDIRWLDIKRLNKEGAGISIKRNINGQVYLLPPGDNRFALPIPEYVISLSGMQQNPR